MRAINGNRIIGSPITDITGGSLLTYSPNHCREIYTEPYIEYIGEYIESIIIIAIIWPQEKLILFLIDNFLTLI